ncbi:MAG: signal peptidase II [Ruminococcus sp.]|nr:signal peptidase II [Ruminococcus sp.]
MVHRILLGVDILVAFYLVLALLLVVVDQVIKYFVLEYLQPVQSVTAIPHLLDLVYVENTGVAFGMFKDMKWLFITITSIVIVLFIILLIKNAKSSKLFAVASALIIGGGIGNLIDRVFLGFVVDYLQLSFFPPVCNFADYCISIGTVLLVIYLLFYSDVNKESDKKEKKLADGE